MRPLELELQGLPGQKLLRSTSKYAIADIVLDLIGSCNMYLARQMTNERLAGVLADLPSGVEMCACSLFSRFGDMFMFTIEGNISNLEKRQLLTSLSGQRLERFKGVVILSARLGALPKPLW